MTVLKYHWGPPMGALRSVKIAIVVSCARPENWPKNWTSSGPRLLWISTFGFGGVWSKGSFILFKHDRFPSRGAGGGVYQKIVKSFLLLARLNF